MTAPVGEPAHRPRQRWPLNRRKTLELISRIRNPIAAPGPTRTASATTSPRQPLNRITPRTCSPAAQIPSKSSSLKPDGDQFLVRYLLPLMRTFKVGAVYRACLRRSDLAVSKAGTSDPNMAFPRYLALQAILME